MASHPPPPASRRALVPLTSNIVWNTIAREELSSPVLQFSAVAYRPKRYGHKDYVVNYWALVCVTDVDMTRHDSDTRDNGRGIVIDIEQNTDPDRDALVRLRGKEYAVTEVSVVSVDFDEGDSGELVDTKRVLKIIQENRLDHYRFGPQKKGSRFWLRKLVELLENEKIIAAGSVARLNQDLPNLWVDEGMRGSEVEIEEGIFT